MGGLMLVCPECGNPAKEGYVFCPEDSCRLIELDNTLLKPGTKVNTHRVGSGTIIASSDDNYLDPDVLCYAILLDQELNGEFRNWFRKRTGVDTLTDWSLVDGQSLPSEYPPEKRYFASHYEVVPITGSEERSQSKLLYQDKSSAGTKKVCPICGKSYETSISYCSDDGSLLRGTTPAEAPNQVIPSLDIEKIVPEDELLPFRDLLDHIDKKNRSHWMKAFSTFKEGKYNIAWNWPSFFFGPWRYCWKGMWLKGITYRMLALLIQAFLVSVFGSGIHFFAWLGTAGFFALRGSNDYYLFCIKYRENLDAAKKQTNIGIAIFCMSPFLIPVIVPVLRFLF
jgi:hypothetical protein